MTWSCTESGWMSELSKGLGFTRDYSHATTQNEKAKLMIDQTAVSLGTNKLLRKVAMSSTSQAKLKANKRQAGETARKKSWIGCDRTSPLSTAKDPLNASLGPS